jgi:hypothetical protein
MKRLLASLLIIASISPAYAWGPRETAALLGFIGGTVVVGAANQAHAVPAPQYIPPPVSYSPVPVYTYPPTTYTYRQPVTVCRDIPYYDHYGRIARIQRVCNYR